MNVNSIILHLFTSEEILRDIFTIGDATYDSSDNHLANTNFQNTGRHQEGSLLVVSEGATSHEEIDNIFKDVLKTPKGPFEHMDVVGLDVVLDIENHDAEETPELS
jgi:3-hydroxyacyl-CoA dehydrogenase, C-terminal domain